MNYNYHIYESDIQCPYCNKSCYDDDYSVAQDLDSRVEFECDHCEKRFWVEASIVYSTYSDCGLNGEKHQFINDSKKYPTVFNCKNCSQTEVRKNK